jgi:hypothetical protein
VPSLELTYASLIDSTNTYSTQHSQNGSLLTVEQSWEDASQQVRQKNAYLQSFPHTNVHRAVGIFLLGSYTSEKSIFTGLKMNNNPEFAFLQCSSGIYSTNTPEACMYITQHSKAGVVVVEGTTDT